jgi:hypothetical protein
MARGSGGIAGAARRGQVFLRTNRTDIRHLRLFSRGLHRNQPRPRGLIRTPFSHVPHNSDGNTSIFAIFAPHLAHLENIIKNNWLHVCLNDI